MKNLILYIALVVFCSPKIEGQRLTTLDTNKYRINLPGYWKPGNQIWRILSDKLPLVCGELKDKDICGDDCNPKYIIEFEMSEPVIMGYYPNHISSDFINNQYSKPSEVWEIQTYYGFECSLYLRNEKGDYITRFILIDTNEVWKISNRVKLASYAPPPRPLTSMNNRRTTSNRSGAIDMGNYNYIQSIPATGQEGQTPYSYIQTNKSKLAPSYRDLLAIVDMKINSW